MIVGYIVMMQPKNVTYPKTDYYAPLAYGPEGWPWPESLLVRGGLASIFKTEEEARAELEKTLKKATDAGAPWPKKNGYRIFEVQDSKIISEKMP